MVGGFYCSFLDNVLFFTCREQVLCIRVNDEEVADVDPQGGNGSATERINSMELKVNTLEPILSVLHGEMNRCISAIEALEAKLQQETVQARDFRQKIEHYESTISNLTTSLSQREAKMREIEARLANLSQDRPDGTLLWRIPNFSQVRVMMTHCFCFVV